MTRLDDASICALVEAEVNVGMWMVRFSLQIFRALVEDGADVNVVEEDGQTTLLLAAEEGD